MMRMQTEQKLEKKPSTEVAAMPKTKMSGKKVDVFYGEKQAIFGVDLDIYANEVTALIGP